MRDFIDAGAILKAASKDLQIRTKYDLIVPVRSSRYRLYPDAFSSREPVSIPDHLRDRLSLENAIAMTGQ